MRKAIIYVHGKGGSCTEAGSYSNNCPGYDMIGFDYEIDLPWIVKGSLQKEYKKETEIYDSVSVIANSIGAFFTMDSLQKFNIEKALFISPILDMEKLIRYMMDQAGVTEQVLSQEKEIQTGPDETLSWDYLEYVGNNKIQWDIPTHILYAEHDQLTSRITLDSFVKTHNADVTVMENGEHWFHTREQVDFLNDWMSKAIEN